MPRRRRRNRRAVVGFGDVALVSRRDSDQWLHVSASPEHSSPRSLDGALAGAFSQPFAVAAATEPLIKL